MLASILRAKNARAPQVSVSKFIAVYTAPPELQPLRHFPRAGPRQRQLFHSEILTPAMNHRAPAGKVLLPN